MSEVSDLNDGPPAKNLRQRKASSQTPGKMQMAEHAKDSQRKQLQKWLSPKASLSETRMFTQEQNTIKASKQRKLLQPNPHSRYDGNSTSAAELTCQKKKIAPRSLS